MTGKVTSAVSARVRKQVDEHGLVVWFDGERCYADALASIQGPDLPVEMLTDSVFDLRRRIEPYLAGPERPRLVVYVPRDEAQVGNALAEATAAGIVMRPGQQPVGLNTRLSVVARAALASRLAPEVLESVLRQVEGGQLGLDELDRMAEKTGTAAAGTLGLIFGTSQPGDLALRFLGETDLDAKLVEKNVVSDLSDLLSVEYGLPPAAEASPATLRERLAKHVLACDLVTAVGQTLPKGLAPRIPDSPELCKAAAGLAQAWRNRRDLQQRYVELAARVETMLGIVSEGWTLDGLQKTQTFRSSEELLQAVVEAALLERATPELVALAEARLQSFWSAAAPELMDRWALVLSIGRVLVSADELERELGAKAQLNAKALTQRYLGEPAAGAPWAVLDTHHRQMERRFHRFDIDLTGDHRSLEHLMAKARQRYSTVIDDLAERFLDALAASAYKVQGIPAQVETFERFVQPALDKGRTALVLVDGLRYEMARELHEGVDTDHRAQLAAVQGTLPSITEIGMAAVLPGAHQSFELVAGTGGKVWAKVAGTLVRNRKERLEYLEQRVGVPTFSARLEALLPPNKKTREAVRDARLVVVTATDELDGLCEGGNVAMARRLMDDVLLQVWRGMRNLFDLGIETVIVTADHGYLFAESLDTGNSIDSPGGQTIDLHRRVWVGRGGAASASYRRVRAADLGLGGDLELALPRGVAGFKAPGASAAYFHGGASPQEILVPVWQVQRTVPAKAPSGEIAWRLTLGSAVISTRFLSIQVDGAIAGLFTTTAPTVRVEVVEGKRVLSRPVASSYGFEEATGFVQLRIEERSGKASVRTNTVTLMIEDLPKGKSVEIVLIDAATERVLARLGDVGVAITF